MFGINFVREYQRLVVFRWGRGTDPQGIENQRAKEVIPCSGE